MPGHVRKAGEPGQRLSLAEKQRRLLAKRAERLGKAARTSRKAGRPGPVGQGRDVSEDRPEPVPPVEPVREEDHLEAAERDFRSSLDVSPLGIRIVGANDKLLFANTALLAMLGCDDLEQLRSVPMTRWLTEESRAEYTSRKEKERYGAPVSSEYEISVLRPDGEVRYLVVVVRTVDWQGERRVQEMYLDITELRKSGEQLRHSQLLASLGEMTAGIAHEVNNPLASIVLYSELLLASELPRQVRKDVKAIHGEAKRAARVMTDLLSYSRREKAAGRRIDLHKIIKRVLGMRRYPQSVQNISVSTNFHDGPLYVKGVSSQLTQLFMNLILNAEQALTQTDFRSIIVSTRREGDWVKVSISDNGLGITPEDLTHIFFPFFTTRQTGQGTGLGLSVCHGIVTDHDGLISAENNVMGGATLTVKLPLVVSGTEGGVDPKNGTLD